MKNHKNNIINRLTTFCLFVTSLVWGGGHEVRGKVYHADTGLPIPGVNVILRNTDLGAATTADGSFLIENVPGGKYNVLYSAIGYDESLDIVNVPSSKHLEIWMTETFLQLEHVVVTGTRNSRINTNSPVATEVISRNDIQESGARDMAELLEERAGISVSSSKEGGKVVSMLGMDSKYVLVMIDGQPISGKFNSRINLDQVSTAIIDKVEIIKGPSSSLYGSEAMGGVINIITNRNIFINPVSVTMRYSGGFTPPVGDFFNPFDLGIGKRDIRMNLNGSKNAFIFHSDIDYLKANVDKNLVYIDVDNFEKYSIRGDMDWAITDAQKLKLNFGTFNTTEQNHSTLLDGQTTIIRNNKLGDYSKHINDRWQMQGIFRGENYYRYYQEVKPNTGEMVKTDTTTESQLEGEFNAIYVDDNKTINLGMEYRTETYANARVDSGNLQSLNATGLYFQYERTFSSKLTLVTGFRADHNNDLENPIISPRIAGMYKLSDRYKLRASWGQGFRMPSFMDKYMNWNHWQFGYAIIGNPDLVPETSTGYNLGIEYFHPQKYKFSVMIYQNKFDNMIIDEQLEPGLFTYSNIDRVHFTGIEFQHRQNYSKNFIGTLAYNLSRNRNIETKEIVPGSPEHSAHIKVSYKSTNRKLRAALKVKMVAPYKVQEFIPDGSSEEQNEGYFDIRDREGYFLIDIDGKYKIHKRVTLSFGIKNIQDTIDSQYGPFLGRTVYFELGSKIGGH
jgi:outer membrane receptor for ferrienterochelin and colicins